MDIEIQHDLARSGLVLRGRVEDHTLLYFVSDESLVASQAPLGKGIAIITAAASEYTSRMARKREAPPAVEMRVVRFLGGPRHLERHQINTRNRFFEFAVQTPVSEMASYRMENRDAPPQSGFTRVQYRKAYYRGQPNCIVYMTEEYYAAHAGAPGRWVLA